MDRRDKRVFKSRIKKTKRRPKPDKYCQCGNGMRCRGASDTVGSISWKCSKCGKTVWERSIFKASDSVVPIYSNVFNTRRRF
jgi:hypothetical protein